MVLDFNGIRLLGVNCLLRVGLPHPVELSLKTAFAWWQELYLLGLFAGFLYLAGLLLCLRFLLKHVTEAGANLI